MFLKLKKQITKIYSISSNFRCCKFFSITQTKPSSTQIQKQKAFISKAIMETIYNDSVRSKPLMDKIFQTIDSSGFHQISKNQMKAIFDQGIKLENNIFDQQRFKNQRVSKTNNQGEKSLYFTHYPTYTITSQVFKLLLDLDHDKKMVMGHYGISKSISISLLWRLTNIINQYRFLNKENKIESKLFRIPKVVFWNSRLIQGVIQTSKNIILSQCPEVAHLQKQYPNLLIGGQRFKKFYKQRNIQVILIMDQINDIASQYRKVQELNSEMLQLKINIIQNKVSIKQKSQQLAHKLRLISQIISLFSSYSSQFDSVVILSPINIQQYILQKHLNVFGQGTHSQISVEEVHYSTLIYTQNTMKQLVLFFMFQLKQILKNQYLQEFKKLQQKDKQHILKECYEYLVSMKYNFFITPYDISKNLKEIIRQTTFLKRNSTFSTYLINLFKTKIVKCSTEVYKDNLSKNFYTNDHNDVHRIKFTFNLYNETLSLYEKIRTYQNYNTNKNKKNVINTDNFGFQKRQIEQFADRRLFRFVNINKVQLLLPPSLVVYILQPIVQRYILPKIQLVKQYFITYFTSGDYGTLFERLLIFSMSRGNVDLTLKVNKQQIIGQQYKFENISNILYGFIPLPTLKSNKNKQNSNDKNKFIQSAEQNKNLIQQKKQQKQLRQIDENELQKNNLKNKNNKKNRAELQQKIIIEKQLRLKRLLNKHEINQRRNTQFNFVNGILPQYNKMRNKDIVNAVFLPFLQQQILKAQQQLYQYPTKDAKQLFKKINTRSPSIDFMIVHRSQEPNVNIQKSNMFAIDATTDKQSAKKKFEKFLRLILSIVDRNKKHHYVKNKDKIYKLEVQLSYFIIGMEQNISKILKQIQQEFSQYITFKFNQKSNYMEVETLEGQQSSLLVGIGYINAKTGVNFSKRTNQEVRFYEQVCGLVKQQEEKVKISEKSEQTVDELEIEEENHNKQ